MSAVTQSAPPDGHLIGFKVHHFSEVEPLPSRHGPCAWIGEYVQHPRSVPTTSHSGAGRQGLVCPPHCPHAEPQPPHGAALCRRGGAKVHHPSDHRPGGCAGPKMHHRSDPRVRRRAPARFKVHHPAPSDHRPAQFVRCVRGGDCPDAGTRLERPAHLSGSGGRTWIWRLVSVGPALRGPAQSQRTGADLASRMPAGGGAAGGFRAGRAAGGDGRQNPADLAVPGGFEPLAQGLQRGGAASGYRDVPAGHRKCGALFRRSAAPAQFRQPQGGGDQGGLV